MSEYMFDAARCQIVPPDEVYLADDATQLESLGVLLTAKEFRYKNGDFEKTEPREWNRDSCLAAGRLIVAAVQREGERIPITTTHLDRMNKLGQFPGRRTVDKFFENFTDFKLEVGSPMRYDRLQYADWGIADYVHYAKKTTKNLGHLPNITDYQQQFHQGVGPSFDLIRYRVGGIRALHDYLGCPNVKDWERTDFVDWGVKVMAANPGKDFSLNIVTALSAERRGPSRGTIKRKCGSWSQFRLDVEYEFQTCPENNRQERESKLSNYRSMIKQETMPIDFLVLPEDEILAAGARYLVVQDCASDLNADRKLDVCRSNSKRYIAMLRKLRPNLTAGDIELTAITLDVFDDIWPIEEPVEHFYVPQKSIDEIIINQSVKHALRRAVLVSEITA